MDSVAAVTTAAAAAAATGGCAATEATDLQDPDAIVCEIIELQMDLDCKGLDYSSLKIFTDNIFKELPSLSPEVRVKKLLNILEMMKKKNNMPGHALSAAGTKRGRKQREPHSAVEPVEEHEDRKRPRPPRLPGKLSLRTDIEKKLEDLRAFAVPYLRTQQAAGIHVDRQSLIFACTNATGVSVPLSTFANQYIIWEDLQAAADQDDITLAPIGKIRYDTIEEAIADARKPIKLRAAADWCVAEMTTLIAAHQAQNLGTPLSLKGLRLKQQLIRRSEGITDLSIHGQFKNCIFSIAKLMVYGKFPVKLQDAVGGGQRRCWCRRRQWRGWVLWRW